MDDWEGTVELAEAVTVPPLSVRIARSRVVRRGGSTVVKAPRNQEVLVDPEGLPGVYMVRVVATLNANVLDLYMFKEKSSLVQLKSSPRNKFVVNNDGSMLVPEQDSGFLNVGSSIDAEYGPRRNPTYRCGMALGGAGECQPELPEGGLPVATTSHRDDLQAESSSLPVENIFGTQDDTHQINMAQVNRRKGQETDMEIYENNGKQRVKRGTQLLGYVPIQIANLSLEEISLDKQQYIGVASPIHVDVTRTCAENRVNSVIRTQGQVEGEYTSCLKDKLAHLGARDRDISEPVLRQYRHLFYGLGSTELGCSSQIEHSIETGEARPIKKNPYRTPHAFKSVVDEHINEMLKKDIIEPSMSPWCSGIVLVQKKSKDGSIKYRICVDYRNLNAVTKPDAYPIPNIVETLD